MCFAKIKRFALSFPQKEKLFFRSFPYLSANFSRHTDRPSVLFCRIAKSLFFRESFALLTCPTFPHAVNFNLRDCRKFDLIYGIHFPSLACIFGRFFIPPPSSPYICSYNPINALWDTLFLIQSRRKVNIVREAGVSSRCRYTSKSVCAVTPGC